MHHETDFWLYFLITMKFLGVLVTAGAGLAGVLSKTLTAETEAKTLKAETEAKTLKAETEAKTLKAETEAEVDQGELARLLARLNVRGKSLLRITGAAVILTLIAQVAEIVRKQIDDRKHEDQMAGLQTNLTNLMSRATEQIAKSDEGLKRSDEQIHLGQQSIAGIKRLVTRFERISLSNAVYSLPADSPVVTNLAAELDQLVAQADSHQGSNTPPFLWSANYGGTNFYEFDLPTLEATFRTNTPELVEANLLLKALLAPTFEFALTVRTQEVISIDSADIRASGKSTSPANPYPQTQEGAQLSFNDLFKPQRASVIYSRPDRQICLHWRSISFPREGWKTTSEIISVADIGGASLILFLFPDDQAGNALSVLPRMRPKKVELSFDNYTMTMEDFTNYRDDDVAFLSYAALPREEEILRGATRKQFVYPDIFWGH
jgi:hypothetical protein